MSWNNALHLLSAIIFAGIGWYYFSAGIIEIIIIVFFALALDLDLVIDQHRSWITHSLLPATIVRAILPGFAIFTALGIAAHLIVDLIESTILCRNTALEGFAAPVHPAFGREGIGWLIWVLAMVTYYYPLILHSL